MKFIPTVTEFEADMQELEKLLYQIGTISYKYDNTLNTEISKEEYILEFVRVFDIESLKEEYELERNKES